MKKIRSVIIDDEIANLEVLADMLGRHCPSIKIVGFAGSAVEGYKLIQQVQPELIFLDIKMPGKTGFDLLRMFDKLDFDIIFVSGFDQYAIQAFEFNALHYILKPIDYLKLIQAVSKVEKKLVKNDSHIIHLIHSLDEKNQLIKTISLHHNDKVHVIDIKDISVIQSIGGYSEVITITGQKLLSTKTLAEYEKLLHPHTNFLRVSRSILINADHVVDYTKGISCFIRIKNHDTEIEVSRRKKTDIIRHLKQNSRRI
jgi:two-component system LytT family response regulator